MSKEWTVQGYSFPNKNEYEKAKKEQESIAYIRANSDFRSPKKVLQVYHNLVEKDIFETIIGYTFMENLRRHIIAKEIVAEELIPPIKIKENEAIKALSAQKADKTDYKKQYEILKQKRSLSMYFNVVLVVVIAAMFAISYYSPKNNADIAEAQVQDEYASWKERLEQQEQQLEQREADILKKEAELQK